MAKLSKRTTILLGIFVGLITFLISLGIWGLATGKLKISADEFWFGGTGKGTISGRVSCAEPCTIIGGKVMLIYMGKASGGGLKITWYREVNISSDGSYSFHRVPLNNSDEYYWIAPHKNCPPQSAEVENCSPSESDLISSQFQLTESNPEVTKNLELKPSDGRLVVHSRRIIVNHPGPGFGQRQSQYASYCQGTGTVGRWDCPVSDAYLTLNQSGSNSNGKTDSYGNFFTKKIDYRQAGTVSIWIKKDDLYGSGSVNVIGCQNNTKKIYLK